MTKIEDRPANTTAKVLSRRSAGVLFSLTSLPCPYGIGDLGPSAYNFIDFLQRAGQTYWQLLPTGPTSPVFGNSPYMSNSALAGNPLLISPELLIEDDILSPVDLPVADFSEYSVEYEKVRIWKKKVLDRAWQRFQTKGYDEALTLFRHEHPWVNDYALFLAIKKKHNQLPWYQWPKELRLYKKNTLRQVENDASIKKDMERVVFEQYLFSRQWKHLQAYSAQNNIHLIGDLPIYVGLDSVDVWANQEIFDLDRKSGLPRTVAGVPPDYFSSTGQRWGNPLYKWNCRSKAVKEQLYDWWQQRLDTIFGQVDAIRIDHFRGFESYWSIPAAEETAIKGQWQKGPGKEFFLEMERRLGSLPIIAEDLGLITPKVEQLRDDLGYPGMVILLFAFDGNINNKYLPHNISQNCVVYSGTHDNDTAVGWYLNPDTTAAARRQAKRLANQSNDDAASFHRDIIFLAHGSRANLAVIPLQDVLGFGNDCRMNTPGTTEGNWQWRCASRFISNELAGYLRDSTTFFGRLDQSCTHPTSVQQPQKKNRNNSREQPSTP